MNEQRLKYVWLGPRSMIPGVGHPDTGEEITMDESLGKKFVAQGKAKLADAIAAKKLKSTEEEK